MNESTTWKGLKLGTPATYRIHVQRRLDDTWTDRLEPGSEPGRGRDMGLRTASAVGAIACMSSRETMGGHCASVVFFPGSLYESTSIVIFYAEVKR